jgi:putative transposase
VIGIDCSYRSTQRHETTVAGDDAGLRAELRGISRDRPRRGYRRAYHLLLEQGWHVKRKRTQRLWREEGLRVPQRRRKRQRLGVSTVPADRLQGERSDHGWAIDFQWDQTADRHNLKLLHVVDEFAREALDRMPPSHRRRPDGQRARPACHRALRDAGVHPL